MSYILMEESLFRSLMGRILNHCKIVIQILDIFLIIFNTFNILNINVLNTILLISFNANKIQNQLMLPGQQLACLILV